MGQREPPIGVDELSGERDRITSALTVVHPDDDMPEHRPKHGHDEVNRHHVFRVIDAHPRITRTA